jgi:RNA polymerase sigma factor (sigma-70 family)
MSPWISDLYLRSQSDTRLLSLTRDGHERAFAILVERYRAELLAQARRLGANGSAEDVVQQTFLSAYSALTGGAEVGHPRGWLHAILRNAATRTHAPVEAPLEEFDACGEPLEAVAERRASARSVMSALEGLPSHQRQALLGSSLQGLSRAELASSLGVSEGAVRQLVHRARMALRGAATALTPYPLARWLADSGPPAGAAPELALTAGAASAGGLLAKVGVFAAAGAVATGVAAVAIHPVAHPVPAHHRRASQRATVSASQNRQTASAARTAPAGAVRRYASSAVAGSRSAAAVGARSSGHGNGHPISRGSGKRGTGLSLAPGSGSGRGSGPGSGPGSGRDAGSGSGRDSGSSSGDGTGSGSSSGDSSGSGSSGDSGRGPSSGGGTPSGGRDASRGTSASTSGDTGSNSGSDSGNPLSPTGGTSGGSGDSSPQGSGGSGSGSGPFTTPGSHGSSGGSTNDVGGSGSPPGPSPTADTQQTGDSRTTGQSSRDLLPSSDSSPVQDH